jgi:ArsR family transcriptional regulator
VCELQGALDAAQSRLSFHLKVLKEAGLVTDRKEGRWSYYRIAPDVLTDVHDLAVAMQPKKGTLRTLRVRQPACCA